MREHQNGAPLVSVITPVYNGAKYLPEAIESILGQTFTDFEYILVNDASPDNSEEIIRRYDDPRLVYLKNEKNLGIAGARNRGLAAARGKYIALMDDDDISLPERLAIEVEFLESHPEAGVVSAAFYICSADSKRAPKPRRMPYRLTALNLLRGCQLICSAAMFRKVLVNEHSLRFNEKLLTSDDYEFWVDLLPHTQIINLPQPLIWYRWHGENTAFKKRQDATNENKNIQQRIIKNLFPSLETLTPSGVREKEILSEDDWAKAVRLLEALANFSSPDAHLLASRNQFLTWHAKQVFKRVQRKDYLHFLWKNEFSYLVPLPDKLRYSLRWLLRRSKYGSLRKVRSYDASMAAWINGIAAEIRFWDNWLETKGKRYGYGDDYESRMGKYKDVKDTRLVELLRPLATRGEYKLLDIGSSLASSIGNKAPFGKIDITAVDPLAPVYDTLLNKHGAEPYLRTHFGMLEALDDNFAPCSFDVVTMNNALDHVFDPVCGIFQMYNIVKQGGIIYLSHNENEAERENYSGFHQWNMSCKESERGIDFVIWNKLRSHNISELLDGVAEVKVDLNESVVYVTIKKLTDKIFDVRREKLQSMEFFVKAFAFIYSRRYRSALPDEHPLFALRSFKKSLGRWLKEVFH